MRPIQTILIVGLMGSLLLYWHAFRSPLRNRILALAFLFAGMIAVLFPNYTNIAAEQLGVGRGTDLIMYIFFVTAVFFGVLFFSKLSRLERCQTELVRAFAIANAQGAEREPKQ
jgi:hypothetical protein